MKWIVGSLCAAAVIVIGYTELQAVSLGSSWASVERVALDAASSSAPPTTVTTTPMGALERPVPEPPPFGMATTNTDPPATTSPSLTTSIYPSAATTILSGQHLLSDAAPTPSVMALVGSDSRVGLEDSDDFGDFPGRRADVIVIAIREGNHLSLLSVPRDLYVEDLCTGGKHRIGEALRGCDDTGGFAHLVSELEHVTGLDIEHLAAVDLAGFEDVVDAVGGYEICTNHRLRDRKSGLQLQAGCTLGDGETTLQWLRSRYTERRIAGTWEKVPAVSDLSRNTRQRRFLTDMFDRMIDQNSPRGILEMIESVAPHLTFDDELSLADAAAWLWGFRSSEIGTAEIPVAYARTDRGASVLVPEVDVQDFVSGLPT